METGNGSEQLPEWEQIQSPFSAVTPELINVASNLVAIKDDFFGEPSALFPDLPINTCQVDDNSHQSESESDSESKPLNCRSKRLHFGAVIQSGIVQIADRFRKMFTCCNKVGCYYLWFAWGGVAAALLAFCIYSRRFLMWRQRRRQLESRNKSLMLVVRDKDKKINELLLQIAQMNEFLLARRRVPVVRVK